MPKHDHPVADPEGSAPSRAAAYDEGSRIDWRQLSHELRTPLNAVLGNLELLLDGSAGPLSAQARTCLGEVQVAGHQLLRQVRLLLAWSELCAGRPKLSLEPIDLIALAREALTLAGAGAVRVEPHDASLPVSADPFWLRMLLAEIATLAGAPGAAPGVRLGRRPGRGTLEFAWTGFCTVQIAPLQLALIDGIARIHGAAVVRNADGLAVHWPVARLDAAQTARGAPGPQAGGPGGGPASDTERP